MKDVNAILEKSPFKFNGSLAQVGFSAVVRYANDNNNYPHKYQDWGMDK